MELFFMEAISLKSGSVSIIKVVNLFCYYKVLYLVLVAKFLRIKTTQPEAKWYSKKLVVGLFYNFNLVTSPTYIFYLHYMFFSANDCHSYRK